jgi:hypothetical protein
MRQDRALQKSPIASYARLVDGGDDHGDQLRLAQAGRFYQPYRDRPWDDDPTFLTGAAGVGLALLAAIEDVEPRWDALLLCDVPIRTRHAE